MPISVFVSGQSALDAGTEVNDEIPENTAFFGQSVLDTGVNENGAVSLHPGFNKYPKSTLADPRFAKADFTVPGYQFMTIVIMET